MLAMLEKKFLTLFGVFASMSDHYIPHKNCKKKQQAFNHFALILIAASCWHRSSVAPFINP
jgi:hypothetical protein